jgi:glycosyltransferase involved in cell wall biosynthesis
MTPDDAPPETLLDRADALRDGGDWAAAEPYYRAYLEHRPLHWQIHVQLGHAVKERGDVAAALGHYRHAGSLAPEAADPALQEGHALRLLGRGRDAAEAMARALSLDPASPLLKREVALLRHRLAAPPEEPAAPLPLPPEGPPTQLAFDVTDLLDYLSDARTPTGIQRVQMGLIGAILDHRAPPAPVLLVAYDPSAWRWWHVEERRFRRVLALSATGAAAEDPAWLAATAALCDADARPDAPLRPGATLASLGNAWGIEDYFRGLRLLRRQVPLRYAAFVHDCVPLVMPEHCLDLTARLYARWFAALALHADMLLANSNATAGDARRFAAPLGLDAQPAVIPLAAVAPPPGDAAAAADALDLEEPDRPFVLFVATLESRKNHLMVFQAWIELLRRLPEEEVPRLVCVGRPGWQADAALGLLARSPALRRKVAVVSGVSDLALAGLTARCVFTVYNSFHEGWGLPVSESLAAGKLCVVPAHTGLLESGAPGAVFFPPGDLPALVATLELLITDPAHRAAAESRIDRAAASRPWKVAAAEALAHLAAPQPPPAPRPGLPAGVRLTLGAAPPPPSLDGAWGEAVRDGLGWWWQEPWGSWTRDGVASLLLPIAEPAGTPLRVVLDLRGPPGGIALRLRARGATPGPWMAATLAADARQAVVVQGIAGEAGIAVDLDSGDGVALGDRAKRRVGVGVVAVMACREDDLPARISALERAAG